MNEDNAKDESLPEGPGILDTVSFSQQSAALRNFNPQEAISQHLGKLDPRERKIIAGRWGLEDGKPQTLEKIGELIGLTRERVRQIEKDAFSKLKVFTLSTELKSGVELIFQIIEERGNIMREDLLLESVLASYHSPGAVAGIQFILHLAPRFKLLKETAQFHHSWTIAGFDESLLEQTVSEARRLLQDAKTPVKGGEFYSLLKNSTPIEEIRDLNPAAIESYLSVSKVLMKNPFDEWGMASWTGIKPRDVGDKAYLVLSHHGQPEHYGKITELVNKHKFDDRVANKESVHNELIKDDRFVLVGRGIYALKEWGYKKGVVAEIIQEILRTAGPLPKEEIIASVLKQRMVKRNTIIVGLSNKKYFRKTEDNKYTTA